MPGTPIGFESKEKERPVLARPVQFAKSLTPHSIQAIKDVSQMHQLISPAILYLGTPVVLVSTVNENGSYNLAPMSSAFLLGWLVHPVAAISIYNFMVAYYAVTSKGVRPANEFGASRGPIAPQPRSPARRGLSDRLSHRR